MEETALYDEKISVEELAAQLEANAQAAQQEGISVEGEARGSAGRKSSRTRPAPRQEESDTFTMPEPPPQLAAELAGVFMIFGNMVANGLKVSPLTKSDCELLGKSWARVADYYAREVDPVYLIWASAIGSTAAVCAPRYFQYKQANNKNDQENVA